MNRYDANGLDMNRAIGLGLLGGAVIALLIAFGCATAHAQERDRWSGVYQVEGQNPGDKKTYTGWLQIERVPQSAQYRLTWRLNEDDGSVSTVRAFGFEDDERLIVASMHGPMPMVLRQNLEMRWMHLQSPNLGREKLTRTKHKSLEEIPLPRPPSRPADPHGHQL